MLLLADVNMFYMLYYEWVEVLVQKKQHNYSKCGLSMNILMLLTHMFPLKVSSCYREPFLPLSYIPDTQMDGWLAV